MIDFSLPDEIVQLERKVTSFIREEIVPLERDPRQGPHGPAEALRLEMVARARAAGLLSPHAPKEYGGLGLDHRGMAVIFEAAGWSPLGPLALNIQAPDEGNTNLLDKVATPEQKARWLGPLARGEIRTIFSMTEPDGGAGSDPSLMKTTARRVGDDYLINGRKWLITGAPGATLNIVMARTEDADGRDLGATMFLADTDAPGFKITRLLNTIDSNSPGGHAEVEFHDVRVGPERILGAVGKGFRYAQVRLGPARLTHCMRWLGAARRCHAIATDYARRRHAFGRPIGEHEGVGFMLADNENELSLCRLAIWHAAWMLDQGEQARNETSMCKVFCSEATGRIVDRSLQILGGMGITDDTVVERTYRDIRAFRIYDGPSEVHRFALARAILARDASAK
ncbi:MAG TPA: acyl-CoA dehydrogenase family protein [Candidatus Binataceae bacterium]|nr:acyl-CoA dehydrogenase family protein [Candidatus Binataceae bacterium]